MAIVPARISLALTDTRGGGGTFLTHVLASDALTIANAASAIAATATAFRTVSSAGIKQGEFTLIDTAVAVDPLSDADVSAGAVFDFSNASNPSTYGLFVGSFLDSLIESNGTIDITSGASAAFVATMIGAVLGGHYANAQYVANLAGLDAFLSSRKRRKRLRP